MTPDRRAAAFTAMFRRHYGTVHKFIRRRTTGEAVDDLVGEVFTTAWRRFDDIPRGQLPWLLATADHCLANHSRSAQRRRALTERLLAQPSVPAAGPHECVVRAAEGVQLLAALRRLEDDQRELVVLTEWDGLAPRQAARVLGISPGAARMRLHRARRALRAAYDEELGAPEPRVTPRSQIQSGEAP